MKKESKLANLLKGLIRENPVFVLVLGTCPTLGTTTSASNAIGMGIAATLVLICSNMAISALRKIIPDTVRIPCYIVLISGFVTVVQLLVKAYMPELDASLGLFLPLIVVNCIILGRAEMYANKHGVFDSMLDAIGMGAGFTLALLLMASIREIFGAGTWFGHAIPVLIDHPIGILTMAPGGFFVFGCCIALVNKLTKGKKQKKVKKAETKAEASGCAGCPSAGACGEAKKEGAEA